MESLSPSTERLREREKMPHNKMALLKRRASWKDKRHVSDDKSLRGLDVMNVT